MPGYLVQSQVVNQWLYDPASAVNSTGFVRGRIKRQAGFTVTFVDLDGEMGTLDNILQKRFIMIRWLGKVSDH